MEIKNLSLNILKVIRHIKFTVKNLIQGIKYPKGKLNFTKENTEILKKQYGKNTQFIIFSCQEKNPSANEIKYSPITLGENIFNNPNTYNNSVEFYLVDSRDSLFSFQNNFLLTSDLYTIFYEGVNFKNIGHLMEGKPLKKPQKLKGTIAYLSNAGSANIFHWLFLGLSLKYGYDNFKPPLEIDYYYVGNKDLTSYQKKTLELAGIPLTKVINYSCSGDRLLFLLGGGISYPTVNYLRKIANKLLSELKIPNQNRLIYVSRGNVIHRYLINENEIIPILEKFGFEICTMDNLSIEEQAATFNSAKIIVTVHGQALANIIFCQDFVKIFELFPTKYQPDMYTTISGILGFPYFYLLGESNDELKNNYPNLDLNDNKADLYIDVKKFEILLTRLISD